MRKITELPETRYKTVREKDAVGNSVSKQVSYTAFREVNVISTGKRFAHAFIDAVVYYVIYYFFEYVFLHLVLSNQNTLNAILTGFFISVIFMFSFPIYYILFEYFLQRTPGKFLTKSLVIDIYGNKPEIGTNLLRNIIRLVPFEIFSCLFSPRGWHDRWSDTFVVTEEEFVKIKELQFKIQNESDDITEIQDVKLPSSKRLKNIFIYVLIPFILILYIGIVYRGCTKVKETLNNPEIIKELSKHKEVKSESNELTDIALIYNNGHIDEAQKKLLEFTKLHKDYHLAWTILGHTYFDQDNIEKAIDAYLNGVKANKHSFDPHNGLGMAYSKIGEYDKAMRELILADSLEPNNSAVLGNLANLYDELGDFQKALEYGEKSVSLDSTNSTLTSNLCLYYYNTKQYRKCDLMYIKTEDLGYESMEALSDMVYPSENVKGFLSISGSVTHENTEKGIESVTLEVFSKDGQLVRRIYTDDEGTYAFYFPLSVAETYKIKVSYPDFIHKYFLVSTEKVPIKSWENKSPKIVADISLSEIVTGVDYSFLNKPLSSYYFNPIKNNFDMDKVLLDASIKKLKALKIIEQKAKQKK